MKRLILSLFTISGIFSVALAQYVDQSQQYIGPYENQSLLFSQQYYGSTARSKAMGNAFGALGGDFSSLSINPAGIAIYQRPEVSLSTNLLEVNSTQSTYQGQSADDRSTNFNFRNFGYVYAQPTASSSSGLTSISFGLGFNRLNSFNQNVYTQALGSTSSRTDVFAAETNGITSSSLFDENNPYSNPQIPWESKLAWENYLIDVANPDANGVGNQYQSFLFQKEQVDQRENINRQGYLNEYVASMGANFNHRFYIGATLGLQDLYYNETRTYSEDGGFGYFDYVNNATSRGYGYNFKIGLIFRPTNELRIGAAIHTPTFYTIKETYDANISSNLQNVSTDANGAHSAITPVGDYQYHLETPFRAIGSVAYQFGKKGLISLDYEYLNYSSSKLRKGSDGYNFATENQNNRDIYQPVANLHVGGEYRVTDAFSLRAGYERFGDPYKSQPYSNYKFNTYNGGIGYRIENVSLDLSYSLNDRTNYMYIYQYPGIAVEPVKYHSNISEIVFTVALKL